MQLDRRITIQTSTRSETYPGEWEETWTDGATVWASVHEATGRELIRAGQVDAEQPIVVTTRYRATSTVTTHDRFTYNGEVLHIRSRREIGRRAYLEYLCVRTDG